MIADTRTSENWNTPLRVLAEAMNNLKLAAVVKRIYANGPKFKEMVYILFTCPDHGSECLLLVKWPSAHEMFAKKNYRYAKKQDHFTEEVKNEQKQAVDAYLSSLTISDHDFCDNGKVLYCLQDFLRQNPNTTSQADHFVSSLLDDEYDVSERKVSALEMNRILQERCEKSWNHLKEMLPSMAEPMEN